MSPQSLNAYVREADDPGVGSEWIMSAQTLGVVLLSAGVLDQASYMAGCRRAEGEQGWLKAKTIRSTEHASVMRNRWKAVVRPRKRKWKAQRVVISGLFGHFIIVEDGVGTSRAASPYCCSSSSSFSPPSTIIATPR